MTDTRFTETEIQCLKRELRLRKKVYPALVEKKRMSPIESAHEIQTLEGILRKASKLSFQGELF